MMAITKNNSNKYRKDPLYHWCKVCQKRLKVSQIQRKRIDRFQTFNIFIFYCRKCDCYYLIFKFINFKKEKGRKKNDMLK